MEDTGIKETRLSREQDAMSDADKPTVSQRENVLPARPQRKPVVRHCLRFWWAYLIAFICIVVLVVCLIIFVGLPHIIQSKLNDATLTVEGIAASNTQTNNFYLNINSTIYSNAGVSATIDGFTGAMYLEDLQPHTPFVNVEFPQTSTANVQTVNISQPVTVANLDAFTAFNTWVLLNETVRVTVSGYTYVKVKGIAKKFGANFIKTVTIPGLNNFQGINVTQSTISLTTDANGDNFKGFVTVPNPSIVTFDIGNATFTNYLLGQDIGIVHIDNMVLRPGNDNNFTMRANVSQAPVVTALGQKPYCTNGGVLPFVQAGISVINNNQPLPYYLGPLQVTNLTTNIDIGGDMKTDLNLTIPCSS